MSNNCCGSQKNIGPSIRQSLKNLNTFSNGFVSIASEQMGLFVDRTINLAEATILTSCFEPKGVCDFPETEDCCPEIACTLIREAYMGERIVESVLLRNAGTKTQTFEFKAQPFTDLNLQQGGTPKVHPDKITLRPNQAKLVKIIAEIDEKLFKPCKRYSSQIDLKGYCEQSICLKLHIAPEDAVDCSISQKECLDVRIHTWRDHFYCDPYQSPRVKRNCDQV